MAQSSTEAYRAARRLGKKYTAEQNSRGHSGLLPVLESQLEEICGEFPLGCREVPLGKIRGTYATGRAGAFAGNFMPLLDENTEFAKKWQGLYGSAAEDGIVEPIKVYEYLGGYYILEGHKRVSVALSLSTYSLSAEITRLLPPLREDDPVHAVYREYIEPDRKLPVGHMWFSVPGRLTKLRRLAAEAYAQDPGAYESPEGLLHGLFSDFRAAYHKLGLNKSLPEITTGDAFWQYADIYGLPAALPAEDLKKNIKVCEPQFILMVQDSQPKTISGPSDLEARQSVWAFLKTGRPKVLFAYCGAPGRRFSAAVHDIGRYALARAYPELETSVIQGLPVDGTDYEPLREAMLQYKPDIVFATDYTMENTALRLSLEFKNALVLYAHDQTPGLLGTYYANTREPAFLMGVLAGALTTSGKVGYLRPSMTLGGREHDLQAFAQGVKTTRPAAQVYYSIPRKRGHKALLLSRWAEMGLDVCWLPQSPDEPFPARKPFPGAYAALCSLSPGGGVWDIYAHGAWHWDTFYTHLASEIVNGAPDALFSQPGPLHFRLGLQSGVIDIHPAGPILGHWPRQLLHEFRKAVIAGLDPLNEDCLVEVTEVG